MPELPEVQTIVTDLKKVLPGLKISDVWCDWKKMVKLPFGKFEKEIKNKKILDVERRGKNILISLSNNLTLLIHQKMTGHLLYGKFQMSKFKVQTNLKFKSQNSKLQVKIQNTEKNKEEEKGNKNIAWFAVEAGPMRDDPENRFIHLMLTLSNGYGLALCDMRKFAKVVLSPADKLVALPDIADLGIDPFDKNFTFEKFSEIIKFEKTTKGEPRLRRGKIKTLLMGQKIVAGIGNIYSDEILWLAGVHPEKPANKLSDKDLKKIYEAVRPILKEAIRARGSSYSDYRDSSGKEGGYQNLFKAYQQTDKPCKKRDGGLIKKIKIGGRSGHFCPVHQKI